MSDPADREPSLDLDQAWPAGPERPFLRPQEAHVWRVRLDLDPDRVGELKTFLSQDELERAARFKFDHHGSHFIVARGCLRVILGRYLKFDPTGIEFSYSAQGKPHVLPPKGSEAPHFNLSHSGDIALIALTRVGEIGVDVEFTKRGVRDMKIAERFFSEAEVRALKEVADDLKRRRFLTAGRARRPTSRRSEKAYRARSTSSRSLLYQGFRRNCSP